MATQFHWVFPLDNRRDELKRARHKIGCLLKEKKERDLHTEWIEEQMEELREDNHFLRHAKVHTCKCDGNDIQSAIEPELSFSFTCMCLNPITDVSIIYNYIG